jgi:hypothetical protein
VLRSWGHKADTELMGIWVGRAMNWLFLEQVSQGTPLVPKDLPLRDRMGTKGGLQVLKVRLWPSF